MVCQTRKGGLCQSLAVTGKKDVECMAELKAIKMLLNMVAIVNKLSLTEKKLQRLSKSSKHF